MIDRKTDSFDASAFTDHYDAALRDLIDRKRKSKKTPRAKAGEDDSSRGGDNVVDLMSALQDSLKADGSDKSGGKSTGRKSSSKTSGAKSSGSKSSKSSGAKSSTKKSA